MPTPSDSYLSEEEADAYISEPIVEPLTVEAFREACDLLWSRGKEYGRGSLYRAVAKMMSTSQSQSIAWSEGYRWSIVLYSELVKSISRPMMDRAHKGSVEWGG